MNCIFFSSFFFLIRSSVCNSRVKIAQVVRLVAVFELWMSRSQIFFLCVSGKDGDEKSKEKKKERKCRDRQMRRVMWMMGMPHGGPGPGYGPPMMGPPPMGLPDAMGPPPPHVWMMMMHHGKGGKDGWFKGQGHYKGHGLHMRRKFMKRMVMTHPEIWQRVQERVAAKQATEAESKEMDAILAEEFAKMEVEEKQNSENENAAAAEEATETEEKGKEEKKCGKWKGKWGV